MDSIVVQPTSTAEWHCLVSEAQQACSHRLSETLESYLVFMLMRYTQNASIADSVLAIDYLNAQQQSFAARRREQLQEVGDKCLLYAGLFPEQAHKKLVKASYFVTLGQGAYQSLSYIKLESLSELFDNLADKFIVLMEVLQAIRQLSPKREGEPNMDALTAFELWEDTASEGALQQLQNITSATPLRTPLKTQ